MNLILNKVDISNLKKAFSQLSNAISIAKSELERAGTIQCFEYSYELAWKTARKILITLGKEAANNPRMVFREAAQNNLIKDPEPWFAFIEYRNKTVHIYNENIAIEIFNILPQFRDELSDFIKRLEALK